MLQFCLLIKTINGDQQINILFNFDSVFSLSHVHLKKLFSIRQTFEFKNRETVYLMFVTKHESLKGGCDRDVLSKEWTYVNLKTVDRCLQLHVFLDKYILIEDIHSNHVYCPR